MKCSQCGHIIDCESNFCQNCGEMVKEVCISLKKLEKILTPMINDATDEKTKCELLKPKESPFGDIETQRDSFDVMLDTASIIYSDGKTFTFEKKEDLLILAVALAVNAFESFGKEFALIEVEFHNDRIAKIDAAHRFYERAMKETDINCRREELNNAKKYCIEGIEELKKEMQKHVANIEKIPREGIVRMKSWFRLSNIRTEVNLFNDALFIYARAIILLLEMDAHYGSKEKMVDTLSNSKEYLDKMLSSEGYKRFCEVDDIKHNVLRENLIGELAKTMYIFGKVLDEKPIKVQIKED